MGEEDLEGYHEHFIWANFSYLDFLREMLLKSNALHTFRRRKGEKGGVGRPWQLYKSNGPALLWHLSWKHGSSSPPPPQYRSLLTI